ncbi:MAG: hypothetical protein JJ902_18060 [Roseibium sp.]|nr:hypothetical protein [Roseibium sp.]
MPAAADPVGSVLRSAGLLSVGAESALPLPAGFGSESFAVAPAGVVSLIPAPLLLSVALGASASSVDFGPALADACGVEDGRGAAVPLSAAPFDVEALFSEPRAAEPLGFAATFSGFRSIVTGRLEEVVAGFAAPPASGLA